MKEIEIKLVIEGKRDSTGGTYAVNDSLGEVTLGVLDAHLIRTIELVTPIADFARGAVKHITPAVREAARAGIGALLGEVAGEIGRRARGWSTESKADAEASMDRTATS